MPDNSDLLRTADVARMLNVSERTVMRWVTLGQIATIRLPSQLRFRRAEVEKILRQDQADQDP